MLRGTSLLATMSVTLFVAACGDKEYTARPGKVQRTRLPWGGLQVQGTFEIAEANPGETRVQSANPTGGACLVTQDTSSPSRCNADADCEVTAYRDVDGTLHVPGDEAYGYCLPYHDAALPKTCWIKPSKNYCVKGPTIGLGKHNTPNIGEGQARAYLGHYSQLSWRVVACVNGNDADGHLPPGCGERWNEPLPNTLRPNEKAELPGDENPAVSHVPPIRPPLTPPPELGKHGE